MKNKKLILIMVIVAVFCLLAAICGGVGYYIFRQNEEARLKAVAEITANFNKTKDDFENIEGYFTDNGLYSEILAEYSDKITAVEEDIGFDKSILSNLSTESKTQLTEYYTKISEILSKKSNQNVNYDEYYALFTDPESQYMKDQERLRQVYNHKVDNLADVLDIIETYDSIIENRIAVKQAFLALEIPGEQEAYKTYVIGLIDCSVDNIQKYRDIYQSYYDSSRLPGSSYDLLITTWNLYNTEVNELMDTYNDAMNERSMEIEDMYSEIVELGKSITVK